MVGRPAVAMTGGDRTFRAALRAWLAQHPPPAADDVETLRNWQQTLHSGGWVGVHWPAEYGGRGASPAQVAIYNEELARAGAPPLLGRVGVTLVGPTLMT
ncbi:MAG TPA: acyl-CoA dehydrogenase family protein, partial [Candidatus Tumulicola sp.]|nr:acyl-CoA dehydrogenase family protein [Candidatus Tumulicola sp.]